jgi:hypothetical protein
MYYQNPLISMLQILSSIGPIIMFFKYLNLFFNRKTDTIPFLMSKNWMIFATIVSSLSIIVAIATAFKKDKTKEDGVSIFSIIPALMTVIAFPLFLAKVISQEDVVFVTKVLSMVNVVLLAIVIALFCCCCCCIGAVLSNQSAAKEENDKKLFIFEGFSSIKLTNNGVSKENIDKNEESKNKSELNLQDQDLNFDNQEITDNSSKNLKPNIFNKDNKEVSNFFEMNDLSFSNDSKLVLI